MQSYPVDCSRLKQFDQRQPQQHHAGLGSKTHPQCTIMSTAGCWLIYGLGLRSSQDNSTRLPFFFFAITETRTLKFSAGEALLQSRLRSAWPSLKGHSLKWTWSKATRTAPSHEIRWNAKPFSISTSLLKPLGCWETDLVFGFKYVKELELSWKEEYHCRKVGVGRLWIFWFLYIYNK